jgi:hypothetical protein
MITAERVALDTVYQRPHPEPQRPRPVPQARSPEPQPSSEKPSLLWRLILFFLGLGLVMLGWPLVVSAVGAFIGLPLIIIGLALMQAQER